MAHHAVWRNLGRLVERRSRRGWWAYLLWLVVYVVAESIYAESFASAGEPIGTAQLALALTVPVAFVVIQWVRPTRLVWGMFAAPSIVFAGNALFYSIAYGWDADTALESVSYIGLILATCASVLWVGLRDDRKTNSTTR